MKQLLPLFILTLVISCSTRGNCQNHKTSLEKALEDFNEAFAEADVSKLEEMVAENYLHTNSSWKAFGKEQWLGYMRSRKEKLVKGDLVIQQYIMDELAIELHHQTAIVTAKITSTGLEEGTPFKRSFRVTNFWVKEDDKWLRAAFHDTKID